MLGLSGRWFFSASRTRGLRDYLFLELSQLGAFASGRDWGGCMFGLHGTFFFFLSPSSLTYNKQPHQDGNHRVFDLCQCGGCDGGSE